MYKLTCILINLNYLTLLNDGNATEQPLKICHDSIIQRKTKKSALVSKTLNILRKKAIQIKTPTKSEDICLTKFKKKNNISGVDNSMVFKSESTISSAFSSLVIMCVVDANTPQIYF
jgi:hypothetical protein